MSPKPFETHKCHRLKAPSAAAAAYRETEEGTSCCTSPPSLCLHLFRSSGEQPVGTQVHVGNPTNRDCICTAGQPAQTVWSLAQRRCWLKLNWMLVVLFFCHCIVAPWGISRKHLSAGTSGGPTGASCSSPAHTSQSHIWWWNSLFRMVEFSLCLL